MSEATITPISSGTGPPKKDETLELSIESLAYGGKGVARHEGFVVFVERALPGQRVQARVTRRRKGYAEARVLEVLEQTTDVAEPCCPHFGVCGGCATQNYPYERQLEQKQAQVADLFARMGHFGKVEVQSIIGCEEIYRYRNKMEFTFSRYPWLVDPADTAQAPAWSLGLHVPGRFDKVLDIHECHLQHPLGDRILQRVKQYVEESGLGSYDIKTHEGFLRHLVIRTARAGTGETEVMVNFVTSREEPRRLKPLADQLAAAFPEVVSVMNNINTSKAAVAYGEWELLLHGKPTITEHLRGLAFDISANSFFQTNTHQAEVLYRLIEESCALTGEEVVYDLYCGTGTIALTLARNAGEVGGFEMASSAVEDAARNALANELYNARFFQADLSARYFATHRQRLQRQIPPPNLVVADPPRAGIHPRLVAEILALAPRKIVYVSCNPATQVRDVGRLVEGGYRLARVQPVDMFPHTPHIECLCVLEK